MDTIPTTPAATDIPEIQRPATSSEIPSLKEHLLETWATFKASLGNLFLLSIVSFLVNAVLFAVIIGGLIGFTANTVNLPSLMESFKTIGPAAIAQIPSSFYVGLAVTFALSMIISSIVSAIFIAAMVFAVGWADKKPRLGELLKAGFSYAGWIILFNFISFFLIFGGFWVFFIGGIIMSIFFGFAMQELLLNNKNPWTAFSSSVTLVAEHFGTVFARYAFLVLAYIVVFVFFPAIIRSISESLGTITSLITSILSWFVSWFALVYSIVLYKHLRAATPETVAHRGLWNTLVGVSIVGWIIALLLGSFAIHAVTALLKKQNLGSLSQQFESELQKSMSKDGVIEPTDFNKAPSTCGLSIPVPAGFSEENPPRHWIYEERMMASSSFRKLVPDAQTKNGVLGAFLAYKTDAERLTEKSTTFAFPGYVTYCVDNVTNLDLYGFTQQALQNKEYTVTLDGETEQWGEVAVQPAFIEGLTSGDYYKEPIYMAVAPGANKLILITPWSADVDDAEATQIGENMTNIQNNLQYSKTEINIP